MFQEISKSTGFKIHVNDLIFKIYEKLTAIQSILTTDARSTPIHACIYETRKRDQNKADLLESQLSGFTAMKADLLNKPDMLQEAMLPCELFALDKSRNPRFIDRKINSVKIILSAMWFTDTAGVENIFVEFKPKHEKELETVAYKYYRKTYRLCFSFHSSMEEIIDFVNTVQPKRLYSIALPEGLKEKAINEYFFTADGRFKLFHLGGCSSKPDDVGKKIAKRWDRSFQPIVDRPLVLRKRKSINDLIGNKDGSDSENSGNESDQEAGDSELKFGSSDEDQSCLGIKKFKG